MYARSLGSVLYCALHRCLSGCSCRSPIGPGQQSVVKRSQSVINRSSPVTVLPGSLPQLCCHFVDMRAGLRPTPSGQLRDVPVATRRQILAFATNGCPVKSSFTPRSVAVSNAPANRLSRTATAVVVSRPSRRGAVKAQAFFGKLFKSDPSEATRKKYQARVDEINALEPKMQALNDDQLRAKTDEFKRRAQNGEALENLLVEAFAVVREASRRVLGLRPFDVQLIGGMILHEGQIAEMRTGEGKTLVAVLPAYLNALSGKGVHVVTVNDYLARRDSEWVGQVHRFLNLKVGLIQADMKPEERRAAYAEDVTYVTNSELGFDYLRDNLAGSAAELVLRATTPFNFCVIDEVDSILIDEARTPLIISGPSDKPSDKYYKAAKIADALTRDVHYTVDEKQKSVLLTEDGYEAVEDVLQVSDLYDPRTQWASYVVNGLKAKELQIKNVNYIVKSDEVIIVDEFTGRTMPGRRWSDGLHQAVEAKEGLPIQNESLTLASVSYQAFFRNFPKLAGMTGTAATEVSEFDSIYKLPVAVVPTNRGISRTDNPDVVFRLEQYKWKAVVTEIKRMHKTGRPVLVGTTSVEKSEIVSRMLEEEGIKHQVLNAKPENVERESEIVAQSGRRGAVTISTNMAGRGTDILLGGNPDYMARLKLREMLMPEVVSQVEEGNAFAKTRDGKPHLRTWAANPDLFPCDLSAATLESAKKAVAAAVASWGVRQLQPLDAEDRLSVACEKGLSEDPVVLALRAAFQSMLGEYKAVTDAEKAEVVALGGLHVVGTERHESRRIDNQLRGRSGRQGDPGSTRFFLSLEDPLFRVFGGDKIKGLMVAFRVEDLPMESQMLTDALDTAQKRVENYFFDIRKNLFDYDQVVNTQRDKVYAERRRALLASNLEPLMLEYAEKTADDILEANVDKAEDPKLWKLDALAGKMVQYCALLQGLTGDKLSEAAGGNFEALRAYMRKISVDAYRQKCAAMEEFEPGLMNEAQRYFVLTNTDALWKEHLQAIKFLQQAVGLRGYAAKDPLTEFKLEGYNLFVEMSAQIRRNVIYNVYMFQPQRLKRVEDGEAQAGEQDKGAAAQEQEKAAEPAKAVAAAASGNGSGKASAKAGKAKAKAGKA
uniref:Protein translocase subunit SecA n=1 Tax=Chlamydomonas leiostraca TaxID=1034604 RepID=A0A7S0R9H9_9CHLO|mmetsp:Transcript_17205/g.43146  ORF Transcript_17205/g.43146 Transcript_17205/m.43146 type:complete len:1111 (+) Transcript_17205:352-3684(+)